MSETCLLSPYTLHTTCTPGGCWGTYLVAAGHRGYYVVAAGYGCA